jgi:hypothetical protein
MSLSIVPECYADTRLAEILTQSKRCNHQKNLGQVANTLKNRLKDLPALGIVDNDKGSVPSYFSEFNLIFQNQDLKLLKHPGRSQFLVMICPAIEQWLLNAANEVNVNPLDFGIKEGLKEFTNLTKSIHLGQSREFAEFVKALVKAEAPSIILLKKWLVDFKDGKSIP